MPFVTSDGADSRPGSVAILGLETPFRNFLYYRGIKKHRVKRCAAALKPQTSQETTPANILHHKSGVT